MRARQAPIGGTDAGGSNPNPRRVLVEKVLRYTAGSVVATVCSEAAFLILYGPVHAAPAVSSGIGWLAGALPNYWLNRTWTWRRQGRPSFAREVVPYVGIVLATLLLAVLVTSLADHALTGAKVSDSVRVILVSGAFLAVYAVMFLLRFFMLDRLFSRPLAFSAPVVTDPSQPGSHV
jgi:putative flippase GtrA